jgi:RHS repeat-associated protein
MYTNNESSKTVNFNNTGLIHLTGALLEENHYYPFGKLITDLSGRVQHGSPKINNYKYNGKELITDLSFDVEDYCARYYDATIGRWMQVDPLAEKYLFVSPYNYCLNNAINFFDPNGEYPFTIHVNSFAPFNYFGPGNFYKGDGANRRFTTKPAGSRISMITKYQTETRTSKSKAFGSMSNSKYGTYAYSEAYLNDGQKEITTTGNKLNLHLYGKMEAFWPPSVPGLPSPGGRMSPTFDIDIHNNLSINATNGVLAISGQIRGDQFPSAEAYATDAYGTSIILGVAPTTYGPVEGPMQQLRGDRDLSMIDINIRISVGEDGAFNGVYGLDGKGNEVVNSPLSHNLNFESQASIKDQE